MLRFIFFIILYSSMFSGKAFAEKLTLYYANIDSSEMAIIHGDYQSAISFYVKAFQHKDKPFADDIYNLSVCYLKTGHLNKAMETCFDLANTGVGEGFFSHHPVFDTLKTMPEWASLLAKAEKIKIEFNQKNASINKKLNLLYQTDQHYHGLLRQMTTKTEDSIVKLVDHQDSIITMKLLKMLCKNGGIASSFQLGAIVDQHGEMNFWPNYFIIILHNYESLPLKDTVVSPFDSLLKKAVLKGVLKPAIYAYLHDFGEKDAFKNYCTSGIFWIVNDKLYINKFYADKGVQQKINRLRAKVMLPILAHYQQKQEYIIKNINSQFILYVFTNKIGNFKDKQAETEFLKGLRPVGDIL